LKERLQAGGEAAMAHASRGRASPRRLPEPVRRRILTLARSIYAGFNDHHFSEKLQEVEGLSLSRETLRRLLRGACAASCSSTEGSWLTTNTLSLSVYRARGRP
jgi:hypothetical protein